MRNVEHPQSLNLSNRFINEYDNDMPSSYYNTPKDYVSSTEYYAPRRDVDDPNVLRAIASLAKEVEHLKKLIEDIPETIKDLTSQMHEVLAALDEVTE